MTKAEEKQTKVVGKIEPQKVDRLGNNEEWIFTDANGYDWKYTFQFPGVMKAYEMLDNARMANGMIAKSILYNEYERPSRLRRVIRSYGLISWRTD